MQLPVRESNKDQLDAAVDPRRREVSHCEDNGVRASYPPEVEARYDMFGTQS